MVNNKQFVSPVPLALVILLTLLMLGGCGAKTNVESLESLSNQQGLVVGTVRVEINNNDVTNQCALFFNGSIGSLIKELPGHLFAFNFDQGRQVLTGINYYEGYPTLPLQNFALNFVFNVQPQKTNYLGDIVINWNIGEEIMGNEASGMDPLAASVLLGPLGVLVSSPKYSEYHGKDVGTVTVDVSYDADGIGRVINDKYGEGLDIVIVQIEGAQLKTDKEDQATHLKDKQ